MTIPPQKAFSSIDRPFGKIWILVALLAGLLGCHDRPSEPQGARILIYQVSLLLKYQLGSTNVTVLDLLGRKEVETHGLNGAIARFLIDPGSLKPLGFGTNVDRIVDPWGEELMCIFRDAPEAATLAPVLRKETWPIYVWSKGPNRIDERGEGDDIVFSKPLVPGGGVLGTPH